MNLTDFLLARIAEDEAVAHEAQTLAGTPWRATYGRQVEEVRDGYLVTPEDEHSDSDEPSDNVALHIARHDPARVLAECEAKRRIVEALIDAEAVVATYDNDDPNNPPSYWQEWGNHHALRLAVELHATAYADHPDYDETWRP